jgi:hypothetical protein
MDDKSTKAYITQISPKDFLKATTTDIKHENEIRKKAGTLDKEKLKNYDMYPPYWVKVKIIYDMMHNDAYNKYKGFIYIIFFSFFS